MQSLYEPVGSWLAPNRIRWIRIPNDPSLPGKKRHDSQSLQLHLPR